VLRTGSEKVTVITARPARDCAASCGTGDQSVAYHAFVLEEGASAAAMLPRKFLDDWDVNVSIFAVRPRGTNSSLACDDRVVNRRKIRHAHMVNITGDHAGGSERIF